MLTQLAFTALLAGVAAQRLGELRKSRRHEGALFEEGALEHAPEQLRWMRLLHGGWLVGQGLEVWLLRRPFVPWLSAGAFAAFVAGQGLRRAAMRALGPRWTVRVLTLPGRPLVATGPYRHLKHPNYLGVALEIAALPLVHGAVVSSVVFTLANAWILRARIRAENRALEAAAA